MKSLPRILITPGEPAGIGPDILIQIAQKNWAADLVAVCDPDLLLSRARLLNLPLTLIEADKHSQHQIGQLKIIPVPLATTSVPQTLHLKNAMYVLNCLTIAAEFCQKNNSKLVTGPVHKAHLQAAGISFTGHTEWLAQFFQVKETVMLFVTPALKVALVTTHLPLKEVVAAITPHKLQSCLRILHQGLQTLFHIPTPHLVVCGLNPHAGESGHLGREEIEVFQPVLEKLRAEKMHITGPLPADTAFLQAADVVVAMYHDQGLPVIKYTGFRDAVNVTLGLPIIRTSVDHGTALTLAGTSHANAGSLAAAIALAIQLTIE